MGEIDTHYLKRYCPYCQARLKFYKTNFVIEYEVPIIPPPGARDLGLKETKIKKENVFYCICPKCGAKYDHYDYTSPLVPIKEIPDKNRFLEKFKKEIPRGAKILNKLLEIREYDPFNSEQW